MKKTSFTKVFVALALTLSVAVVGCKDREAPVEENSASMTDAEALTKTDLQIQEIILKKKAFKKLIDVSDTENKQTYTFEVGSFDEQLFEEAMDHLKLSLVKKVNAGIPRSEASKKSDGIVSDLNAIFIEVVKVRDESTRGAFMVNIAINKRASKNARPKSGSGVHYTSGNWPNQAQLGRSPFSTGNVDYTLETKRRWWTTWNYYNNGTLDIPDERNWFPSNNMCDGDDCYRVRFVMSWDDDGSWLYNFF